jgi:DNA-binding response OmpR family regulator
VTALKGAGFEITAFPSSMSAWEAVKRQDVDLLITDVRLRQGEPNGLALALAARSEKPERKVLFLSFDADDAQYTAGVGDLLRMPVTPSDLVTRSQSLLGGISGPAKCLSDPPAWLLSSQIQTWRSGG